MKCSFKSFLGEDVLQIRGLLIKIQTVTEN